MRVGTSLDERTTLCETLEPRNVFIGKSLRIIRTLLADAVGQGVAQEGRLRSGARSVPREPL